MYFLLGFLFGIAMYIVWKVIFGKYLPYEDSLLLKVISCVGYVLAGIILGITAYFDAAIIIGILAFIVVLLISYGFGIYYKVIKRKRW